MKKEKKKAKLKTVKQMIGPSVSAQPSTSKEKEDGNRYYLGYYIFLVID